MRAFIVNDNLVRRPRADVAAASIAARAAGLTVEPLEGASACCPRPPGRSTTWATRAPARATRATCATCITQANQTTGDNTINFPSPARSPSTRPCRT